MDAAPLDQSKLDEVAEEFSDAIRRGQNPSIGAFLNKYPDPSGNLRSLLTSIEMIEGLKPQSSDSSSPVDIQTPSIDELDDYTIIREIGRGGMGIVFEAIHQSLGRRVAIKVLANRLLGDEKHLARFRREARAAARLRHTNIVPVFGVGQAEGHHYYVMDYIDGMSLRQWLGDIQGVMESHAPTLDEALANTDASFETIPDRVNAASNKDTDSENKRSTPTQTDTDDYFRWVAHLMMTTCDALQYAHQQGVLHRDIKPANLLIDRKGEVWIADFGLAKLTEPHAGTMTGDGDIVGTPQYMPPESFEGLYDAKSEIYAVGLTLYELLTRRPAIEGKGAADVIRKASAGVSAPPRKINPCVPLDLETIVLKSLAHDPCARYASAGEMHDDLERFLTDRPISARRTGPIERLVRWSRREPTVALLTVATFCLLLALAGVSAVGYWRTRDALASARTAQQSAEDSLKQKTAALSIAGQQKMRAEKNLQVALTAFDQIMRNISDRGIEPDAELLGEVADTTSPNVTPEDARLLQSLLGFFDELATNNSEDLLEESAVAARHAADIYLRLGQLRQADRAYSEALERYGRLAPRPNAPQHVQDALGPVIAQAEIMNDLAVITGLRGQLGRANQLFDETRSLLKDSQLAMESPAGQFEYAKAHRLFASIGARTGLDGGSAPAQPDTLRRPRRPLNAMRRYRTEEELNAVSEAINLLESLNEQFPDDVRYRAELARAYRDKAKVASQAKQKAVAEEAARESIELFEKLLSENDDSEAIRYELAMTLSSSDAFNLNQMFRAIRANNLSSTLLANSPKLPRYQALQAHTLVSLATQQQRAGRLDGAVNNLSQALLIYNSLISESPELSLYETRRSQVLESMADLELRRGDSRAAIKLLKQAIRYLQPQLRRLENSPVARIQLQRMRQKLSRIEDNS